MPDREVEQVTNRGTEVPTPSQSWIDCRMCLPRVACEQHRAEARAYYDAVRAEYLDQERKRLGGVTHD